jgi:hypothetical protein
MCNLCSLIVNPLWYVYACLDEQVILGFRSKHQSYSVLSYGPKDLLCFPYVVAVVLSGPHYRAPLQRAHLDKSSLNKSTIISFIKMFY